MRNLNHLSRIAGLAAAAALNVSAFASDAQAWTETVLHSFASGSDGADPAGNLIADQNGNIFGTTVFGGGMCKNNRGCGTVFKVPPDSSETVLYAFHNQPDGSQPNGGLVVDSQENLYGTTSGGGKGHCGTVFEVTQQGVETVLYSFKCGYDGDLPLAGLAMDGAGNLYGTTSSGGGALCECGTVFEVRPKGAHSILYSFQGTLDGGTDGADPQAPVIFDAAGNLVGSTLLGGSTLCSANGCGTIFRLAPNGAEAVFHAFRGGHDGLDPQGSLMLDMTGNVYGTTGGGGGTGCGGKGCGTVFKITPDASETILSDFNRIGGPSGPIAGVILNGKGSLFGTTGVGGTASCGTAFKIAPGRKAKSIYSFACRKDGAYPAAGLLLGANGVLYGTTESGGTHRLGTVFALKK